MWYKAENWWPRPAMLTPRTILTNRAAHKNYDTASEKKIKCIVAVIIPA